MKKKAPFDRIKAAEGHPLVTRAGKPAYWVGRIPDVAGFTNRNVVVSDGGLIQVSDFGTWHHNSSPLDVFLEVS
jgi:hypothetical protein